MEKGTHPQAGPSLFSVGGIKMKTRTDLIWPFSAYLAEVWKEEYQKDKVEVRPGPMTQWNGP